MQCAILYHINIMIVSYDPDGILCSFSNKMLSYQQNYKHTDVSHAYEVCFEK